jgi:EAL domain-containing protein (putative c-di-GMP-specific phosphodiesterase class I)
MTAAFEPRSSLPLNCFLAINVTPDELARPVVRRVLDQQDDLAGVVIELTEQTRIDSYLALEPYLNRYKAAGALIAVDDAGSGYAGLQHLISPRPAIIKLDRHFVDGIDGDEAKRALVEMLGTFADRTDCWLLAEGIERPEELEVIAGLGVPLAQGYLLGRPAPP